MIVGVARAGSDVRDGDCWSAVPPPCNLYGTDTCRFLHRSSPYTNSPHRLYNNDNDNDNDDDTTDNVINTDNVITATKMSVVIVSENDANNKSIITNDIGPLPTFKSLSDIAN